jgi:hypothetical protein
LMEPPVPLGLADVPDKIARLFVFFNLDPLLIKAAAMDAPAFDSQVANATAISSWLTAIAAPRQTAIIQRLICEDPVALKNELLSEIRESQPAAEWPTAPPRRTLAQLFEVCEGLNKKEAEKQAREATANAKQEAYKAEKERKARMAEMSSAPGPWLLKASRLVEARGRANHQEAVSILADLRDAVGGEEGREMARKHALYLATKYPTLKLLKSLLRKQQLWG